MPAQMTDPTRSPAQTPSVAAEEVSTPAERDKLISRYWEITETIPRLDREIDHASSPEQAHELRKRREALLQSQRDILKLAREEGWASRLIAAKGSAISPVMTAPPSSPPRPFTYGTAPTSTTATPLGRYLTPPTTSSSTSYPTSPSGYGVRTAPPPPAPTLTPVGSFRKLGGDLPHTHAVGTLTTRMADQAVDAGHLRPSHHPGGTKLMATQLIWTAIAIGVEAAAVGFTRQVAAGHVPFDFFPKSRNWEDEDDDDY